MLEARDRLLLQQALSRERRKCFALCGIPVAIALSLYVDFCYDLQIYTRGPASICALLGLCWMYLLREAPAQCRRIVADLQSAAVQDFTGMASVLPITTRYGLLQPARYTLLVAGQSFDICGFTPEALHAGQAVQVRSGSSSRVLLSVNARSVDSIKTIQTAPLESRLDLSARELRILDMLRAGLPDKLIARQLQLTPATVRTYNSVLFRKLGVKDRAAAITRAQELGLGLSIDSD